MSSEPSSEPSFAKNETDCEKFANDTIADIKATVIDQQRIVDEVPNGDLCAAEGQEEVIKAKNATETAKTEAEAAEKALNTTETDKARICTAGVDLPTVYLNQLQNSCFNYEDTLAYEVAKGKCKDAKEAVKKATEAAKQAKEDVKAKEDEQEEHEKEAQRLKSGCLCDTHQRQTKIQAAQEKATSTHQSEWTRAHEVLCALKQTPECDIPPCPTVERRTLAEGVAEAKEAHCTRAPTKSPTKSPTKRPTKSPTKSPTRSPTKSPTKHPYYVPANGKKGCEGQQKCDDDDGWYCCGDPTCNLKRDCKSNGGLNGCACPLG